MWAGRSHRPHEIRRFKQVGRCDSHSVSSILRCEAIRWVSDDPFPGWIEVSFTDAHGHLWKVFDKPPVFGSSVELTADAPFPVTVELDCEILTVDRHPDQDLVTISTLTPWGVSTEDGRSEFIVFAGQLSQGEVTQ